MSLFDNNKFVLNLALNGVIPTKKMTPFIPITPEEALADIDKAQEAGGITYLHLHARDDKGVNTHALKTYAKFIEPIRVKYSELPICVSCSGRLEPGFQERSRALNLQGILKPDMASLTLSSLNFLQSASISEPNAIIQLAELMLKNDIKPEIEIFDVGMMNFAHYLIKKEILQPPYYFNIILGNISSAQAKVSHLSSILQEMPDNAAWSLGGIGSQQTKATLLALSQGGGIRTGLEDNIWFDSERSKLTTNQELIKRVHTIAKACAMEMVTPDEFRKKLNLNIVHP